MRILATSCLLLLLSLLVFILAGPLQETQNDQLDMEASTVFDQPVQEKHVANVETSEPLTLHTLQDSLSYASSVDTLESIGGYSLDSDTQAILYSAIEEIESQDNSVGFVLLDISTGKGLAYNTVTQFYSASTIKSPYVVSVVAHYPESLSYWYWEMIEAIEYSDEEAYFALRSAYGEDPLIAWCQSAGVDTAVAQTGSEWFPYCTVTEFAKLWLQTYEFFESGSEDALEVKSWHNNTYNSVISNNLGTEYSVCSKAGWIAQDDYYATADAGIVYAGEEGSSPYLLVIMSDVPSYMPLLDSLVLALDEAHSSIR